MDEIRTVADITRHHAKVRPGKTAIWFEGRETSYGELDRRASRVANALTAAGVGHGGRVAILAKNSDLFFELLFGCNKIGAVLVPVNFRLAPPEVAYVVNDATAQVLVVGQDFHPLVEGIAGGLRTVRQTLALDGGHGEWPDYAAWRDAAADTDPMLPLDPAEVSAQMYSSGTTGHPKGAQLTHEGFLALFEVAKRDWNAFDADQVFNVTMPLFHVAGSEWGMIGLYCGAKNVLLPDVDPPAILRSLAEHRVTKALFVPAVILFLLQDPSCESTDFSALKEIYYGASPIPLPLLERAVKTFGCDFIQLYGLTETTGAITYLEPAAHDGGERMKSCGRPIASAEIRVVDADGKDCPVGQVGEIVCRSKQVMRGYWNLPEADAQAIRDGWFHSGDAGYFDADGYLYIYDRVKDMIVSGGENVYPAEVESALFGHEAVADVAVIGVPDDRWGEAVKAIVVPRPGADLTAEQLIAYARERIAGYKVPRSIDFAEALPRNPSGKILKRELRKPYWEGQERQVH